MSDPKPSLSKDEKVLLRKKNKLSRKRPEFRRQEWFRYGRLGDSWRKPRGKHSKQRERQARRPPIVEPGFRGPRAVRGLHPSGFREVLVYNTKDLEKINASLEAARIAATVGGRKRAEIEEKAGDMGIRVLNRGSE